MDIQARQSACLRVGDRPSSDPQGLRSAHPLSQISYLPRRESLSRNANKMVAIVNADTIIIVAGMPMKSPMKPAYGRPRPY